MSWVNDVLSVAGAEIGTTEYPAGSNRVKYNAWYYGREVSGAAYPWCMAFVQWTFDHAGHTLPYKTASCSALLSWYKANKPECVADKPVRGAIVIYDGHTGIVDEPLDDGTMWTVEGNTSDSSRRIDANGGGVFRNLRRQSAAVAFIIPYETEEEENMTGEEILEKIPADKLLAKIQEYLKAQPLPEWAKSDPAYQRALAHGTTDGSTPLGLAPRYQVAIMAERAAEAARK